MMFKALAFIICKGTQSWRSREFCAISAGRVLHCHLSLSRTDETQQIALQLRVILKSSNFFGGWDLYKTFGTINSKYCSKRNCGIGAAMPRAVPEHIVSAAGAQFRSQIQNRPWTE